ncbi:hypothetical protein H2204_001909 [Knufia peltigerae]|uniref:MHYT domain-containing protein n=1 Tax=Knufia peltigerae TaxID=1002370 RepID=A0AA39D3H9_9EURO|nr:hypothetical protein H2204_001909 [Knufia peltigerae]
MGGIGIWAMHFVGNRAIVLDHANHQRQILYNQGFTAASFFLPIVVLIFAFYLLGTPAKARQLHVALAGILTGAAVCGMHYMGQLGIANYNCSYSPGNVVGAAIISVAASLISLSLFFRMRDKWSDLWWKRTLCAGVLALAVSGMHWTAAAGTMYHWRGDLAVHGESRTQTSVAASCLSMGACVVLLVVIGIRGRRRRNARIRSQRLVLACSYFDDEGNLMITQDGLLPSTKITNHYVERTFGEDELSRTHETFLWIFQASHHWKILKDIIPGMKSEIETDPNMHKFRPGSNATALPDDTSEISHDFARVFKGLFCVAAQQLANTIHEPLEKLGVLFEEPMDTGVVYCSPRARKGIRQFSLLSACTMGYDAERGSVSNTFTRGKYLFLVREINHTEAAKFASLGYRFAAIEQIAESLSNSMQVNRSDLVERMLRIRTSAARSCLPPPGTYLACFMLKPSMCKSFDLLVPDDRQNQLPHVTLQVPDLSAEQKNQLQYLDDMPISEILKVLLNRETSRTIEEGFRWQLYNTFVKLVDLIGDYDSMMQAKFSAKEFYVGGPHGDAPSSPKHCTTCILYTVRILRNIHASPTRKEFTFVPLTFFSTQQQAHTAHAHNEVFAQRVEQQFGYLHKDVQKRGRSSATRGRTPSLADPNGSRSVSPKSPRSPTCISPLRRSEVSRRSDEVTIVDHDKGSTETSGIEMRRVKSCDRGYTGRGSESPEGETRNWVTDVFGLFQLKSEGWATTKPGGWGLNINVHNSVEIATKDRRKGSTIVSASF